MVGIATPNQICNPRACQTRARIANLVVLCNRRSTGQNRHQSLTTHTDGANHCSGGPVSCSDPRGRGHFCAIIVLTDDDIPTFAFHRKPEPVDSSNRAQIWVRINASKLRWIQRHRSLCSPGAYTVSIVITGSYQLVTKPRQRVVSTVACRVSISL